MCHYFHTEYTGISDAWWDLYTKKTRVAAVISCKPTAFLLFLGGPREHKKAPNG